MSDEKVCPGTVSIMLLTSEVSEHRESRLACWGFVVAPAVTGLKLLQIRMGELFDTT